jgi:hypothetical protein
MWVSGPRCDLESSWDPAGIQLGGLACLLSRLLGFPSHLDLAGEMNECYRWLPRRARESLRQGSARC